MRIATAAYTAAPSLPATPAPRPSSDDASDSASPFASQLSAATAHAAPQAATLQSILPLLAQPAILTAPKLALPRAAARPMATGILARATAKQSRAAKSQTTDNNTGTAPVAVTPAPTPELIATASEEAAAIDTDADIASQAAPKHAAPEESADPVAPIVTKADGTSQQPQDMAFAARVQPVGATDKTELPAEMASSSAVAAANKKIEPTADEANASAADARIPLTAAPVTLEKTVTPAATPAAEPAHVAASHRMEAPAPAAETAPKSTAPLKDISLQVNQPGQERIDVRVVQQGNEVHVSVHSGDAILNGGLRQGLSDLQSRLEENGYRSEMWRPGVATAPVAASNSPQASSNFPRGGDGQPQSQGGSQQESGRRNQNQSNQPRWMEEMESSLNSGPQSSGGFYGFGS